jgi:hypothetical protein
VVDASPVVIVASPVFCEAELDPVVLVVAVSFWIAAVLVFCIVVSEESVVVAELVDSAPVFWLVDRVVQSPSPVQSVQGITVGVGVGDTTSAAVDVEDGLGDEEGDSDGELLGVGVGSGVEELETTVSGLLDGEGFTLGEGVASSAKVIKGPWK